MGRRELLLDAAIEVLGTHGARGLTHRAVDAAAGIPAGSTSNHFRTRRALIEAIVGRLEALDRADWEAVAARFRPTGVPDLAAALAENIAHATGPARTRTAARYALFLEAAARPELRSALARGRAAILAWGTEWLRLAGSPDPAAHTRTVLDYLEGATLHRLTFPEPGPDPEPALRDLLAGLFGRQPPAPARSRDPRPT